MPEVRHDHVEGRRLHAPLICPTAAELAGGQLRSALANRSETRIGYPLHGMPASLLSLVMVLLVAAGSACAPVTPSWVCHLAGARMSASAPETPDRCCEAERGGQDDRTGRHVFRRAPCCSFGLACASSPLPRVAAAAASFTPLPGRPFTGLPGAEVRYPQRPPATDVPRGSPPGERSSRAPPHAS